MAASLSATGPGLSALLITAKYLSMPIPLPSCIILSTVSMDLMPGSTTAIMASTPLAVARPRCSMPASMSSMTRSFSRTMTCLIRALTKELAGHMQPEPPESMVPMTTSLTLSGPVQPHMETTSSTLGFILNMPPGIPARSSTRSLCSVTGLGSSFMPRAEPRFMLGSTSMARTL